MEGHSTCVQSLNVYILLNFDDVCKNRAKNHLYICDANFEILIKKPKIQKKKQNKDRTQLSNYVIHIQCIRTYAQNILRIVINDFRWILFSSILCMVPSRSLPLSFHCTKNTHTHTHNICIHIVGLCARWVL